MERSAPVGGEKKKNDNSGQWEFHGGRPLGGSGPSSVSGARHWGQVSSASGWIGLTTGRFSLLVEVESRCLAFSSK